MCRISCANRIVRALFLLLLAGPFLPTQALAVDTLDAIKKRGLAERCEVVGGDFFASVPAGGDAYIMKHIVHDWDDERALTILQNCHRAMTENGKLLVVEMVIPEGNAPSLGKFLDLEMLLFLHSYERTEAEYRALFERARFRLTKIVPTRMPHSVIEAIRV